MRIAIALLIAANGLAQPPVEVIALHPEEVVEAKKLVEGLRSAQARERNAVQEWDILMKLLYTAHSDLQSPRYSADFRFVVGRKRGLGRTDEAVLVPVKDEDRTRAQAAYLEREASIKALQEAQKALFEFKIEVLADHVPSSTRGGADYVTKNGREYRAPDPWGSLMVFTSDFRHAIPYIN